jgi:hypothetical protein
MTNAERRLQALAAYDLGMTAADRARLYSDKPLSVASVEYTHAANAAWATYAMELNKIEVQADDK